ncbi:hypothetical protein H6A60_11395 [Sutterella massiliensis]|uniref:Uncharacterized protein n=1 Tax=Sutterella massiliensis TaxID=1816689 RepID=A0ABS2DUU5_9BURK|nr:hypothetical protein [Sutterella massiliensis]
MDENTGPAQRSYQEIEEPALRIFSAKYDRKAFRAVRRRVLGIRPERASR